MTADAQNCAGWNVAGGAGRGGFFRAPVRLTSGAPRQLATRGAVLGSAVFDKDDRIFVADMAGWVHAFTSLGRVLWHVQLDSGVSASPALDPQAGLLFIGTHAGSVYALRAADGTKTWQQKLPSQTDPRILADLLYVPARNRLVLSSWGGQFHSLDATTGEMRQGWDAGLWPQAGACADAHGNVYCLRAVGNEGIAFLRVLAQGGEETIHLQREGSRGAKRMLVGAAPVLDESRGVACAIFNRDRDCEVLAWSLGDRRNIWRRPLPATIAATPAIGPAGMFIFALMDGSVHAFGPDGEPGFVYPTGSDYLLSGPVCSADGHTFVADPLGRLHVLDGSGNGTPIFEAPRSIQARPAFDSKGNLHVPSTNRAVYVFENSATAAGA